MPPASARTGIYVPKVSLRSRVRKRNDLGLSNESTGFCSVMITMAFRLARYIVFITLLAYLYLNANFHANNATNPPAVYVYADQRGGGLDMFPTDENTGSTDGPAAEVAAPPKVAKGGKAVRAAAKASKAEKDDKGDKGGKAADKGDNVPEKGDKDKESKGDKDKESKGDKDKESKGDKDKESKGNKDKESKGNKDKESKGDRHKESKGEKDKEMKGDKDKEMKGDKDKESKGDTGHKSRLLPALMSAVGTVGHAGVMPGVPRAAGLPTLAGKQALQATIPKNPKGACAMAVKACALFEQCTEGTPASAQRLFCHGKQAMCDAKQLQCKMERATKGSKPAKKPSMAELEKEREKTKKDKEKEKLAQLTPLGKRDVEGGDGGANEGDGGEDAGLETEQEAEEDWQGDLGAGEALGGIAEAEEVEEGTNGLA